MSEFIISKKQFEIISDEIVRKENKKLAEQNWVKFSEEEKIGIVEMLCVIYPNKKTLVKESKWYNTLGDIVGIFDPTGVVDLVNGISYIKQGDTLFGFLSIVSAVPYGGDIVAKPVMGALKIGAPSAKALNGVLKIAQKGTPEAIAKASADLAKLSATGGLTAKFVRGMGRIAEPAKKIVEKLPKPFGGLKKTILQWFDLFKNAAAKGTAVRLQGQKVAQLMSAKGGTKLSQKSIENNLKNLIQTAKDTGGVFSGYRTTKGVFSWKTLFRGMPQLMNRNASVRALMRQSKWWLGFLDFVGVANFVGPEELTKSMGNKDFTDKMNQYQNTAQSQKYFQEEYGSESREKTPQTTQTTEKSAKVSDPFGSFLDNIFSGK
jgi:hypothetical protein